MMGLEEEEDCEQAYSMIQRMQTEDGMYRKMEDQKFYTKGAERKKLNKERKRYLVMKRKVDSLVDEIVFTNTNSPFVRGERWRPGDDV